MLPSFVLTLLGWTKNEITGMTSRTPVRLTPHRGPLATPSASPESSPTASTPPTDISYCPTSISPSLDMAILQHRISTLYLYAQRQSRSRWWHQFAGIGLLGSDTEQRLAFVSLASSACDVMNVVAGIVTFCVLVWGLLEWSSYTSKSPGQFGLRISVPRFPLPYRPRTLPIHGDPSPYEPGDQHVAVLEFLSEQIRHAKALSTLSVGLGLPLRAYFEAHRTTIPSIAVHGSRTELPPHLQDTDILTNLTDSLDATLLDFTPTSFVGRSFTLALDELGGLISERGLSRRHPHYGVHPDARLQAIYWRTISNLLLEYSAARPRARRLLQHVRAVHHHVSLIVLGRRAAESIPERSNSSWWKGVFRPPATTLDGGMATFVTGLEVTLDNLDRLIAYLDWMTEHLARTTLRDVLEKRPTTDFSSCLMSLQGLFAQSWPPTPKKRCFCQTDLGVMSPRKVDVMVPGSPTVRAGR